MTPTDNNNITSSEYLSANTSENTKMNQTAKIAAALALAYALTSCEKKPDPIVPQKIDHPTEISISGLSFPQGVVVDMKNLKITVPYAVTDQQLIQAFEKISVTDKDGEAILHSVKIKGNILTILVKGMNGKTNELLTKTFTFSIEREELTVTFPDILPGSDNNSIKAGDEAFFATLAAYKFTFSDQSTGLAKIKVNDMLVDAQHRINMPGDYTITLEITHPKTKKKYTKTFKLTVIAQELITHDLKGYRQMKVPNFLRDNNFVGYEKSLAKTGYGAALALLQDEVLHTTIPHPAILPEIVERGGAHGFERVREVFGDRTPIKMDAIVNPDGPMDEVNNEKIYAFVENYAKENPQSIVLLEYNGGWGDSHGGVGWGEEHPHSRKRLLDKYPNICASRPLGRIFDEATQAAQNNYASLYGLTYWSQKFSERSSTQGNNGNKYSSNDRKVNPWLMNNDLPPGQKTVVWGNLSNSDSEGAVLHAADLGMITTIQNGIGNPFSTRKELLDHINTLPANYLEPVYHSYRKPSGGKERTDEKVMDLLDFQDYIRGEVFAFNPDLLANLQAGKKTKLFAHDFDNQIITLEKELGIVKEQDPKNPGKICYYVDPSLLTKQGYESKDYEKVIKELGVFVAGKPGEKERSYYIPQQYRKYQ